MLNQPMTPMTVMLDKETKKAIGKIADKKEMYPAQVARLAIKEFIEKEIKTETKKK